LVVRRSGDLIVLLGDVLGFLKDRREIKFSHHSTEVRTRLRPSAALKTKTRSSPDFSFRIGCCTNDSNEH
jgi:hypothetical protein